MAGWQIGHLQWSLFAEEVTPCAHNRKAIETTQFFSGFKKPSFDRAVLTPDIVSNYQQTIHKHLIEQCMQGNPQAQREIYRLYAAAMYTICRRFLGNDDDAQDILQESFMDVFQKLPELRETGFFSAWIKRIVTNNCINALRKKRLLTSELKENFDRIDDEEDDFDYSSYQMERVKRAMEELPDGCLTVLNMYVFEGFDHKEIGEILGISESASKAQYCKAKARIRQQLVQKGARHAG